MKKRNFILVERACYGRKDVSNNCFTGSRLTLILSVAVVLLFLPRPLSSAPTSTITTKDLSAALYVQHFLDCTTRAGDSRALFEVRISDELNKDGQSINEVQAALANAEPAIDRIVAALPKDPAAQFNPDAIAAALVTVGNPDVRKALQNTIDDVLTQLSTQEPLEQAALSNVARIPSDVTLSGVLTDLTRVDLNTDISLDRASNLIQDMHTVLPPLLLNLTPDSTSEALSAANQLTNAKTLERQSVQAATSQIQTLLSDAAGDDAVVQTSIALIQSAPAQLDTAIHSILDAIDKGDAAREKNAAADALEDLEDVKATSDILASMVSPLDPKMAGYISDVGTVYDAVDGAIGDFADGDIDVIGLTGDILGGVGILDDLFGGASQSATPLIVNQIDRLQSQLSELQDVVVKNFAQIDDSLSKIYAAINQGFTEMRSKLDEIGTNQKLILSQLASINTTLYNINTDIDTHFRDFVNTSEAQTKDACLEHIDRFKRAADAITPTQYNACITFFKILATDAAADSNHTSNVDTMLNSLSDLSNVATAQTVTTALQSPIANPNVVAKLLYLLGDEDYHDIVMPQQPGSGVPARIPNGYVWISAVSDMQRFRESWSKFYDENRVDSADAVRAMRASGNTYLAAVRPLTNKRDPWIRVLNFYADALKTLVADYKKLDRDQQNSFSKRSGFITSFNLWMPSSTPVAQPTFKETIATPLFPCGTPPTVTLSPDVVTQWYPSYALLAEDLGIARFNFQIFEDFVPRYGSQLGVELFTDIEFTSDFLKTAPNTRAALWVREGDAMGLAAQDNGCSGGLQAMNAYISNNWNTGANIQGLAAVSPNGQRALCIIAPNSCSNGQGVNNDFMNKLLYADNVPYVEQALSSIRSQLGPNIIAASNEDPAKTTIANDAAKVDLALALFRAMTTLALQPWMAKNPQLVSTIHSSAMLDSMQSEREVVTAYHDMSAYSVHIVDLLADIKQVTAADRASMATPGLTSEQFWSLTTALDADVDGAVSRYYANSANHELDDSLARIDQGTETERQDVVKAITTAPPSVSPVETLLSILKTENIDYYVAQ